MILSSPTRPQRFPYTTSHRTVLRTFHPTSVKHLPEFPGYSVWLSTTPLGQHTDTPTYPYGTPYKTRVSLGISSTPVTILVPPTTTDLLKVGPEHRIRITSDTRETGLRENGIWEEEVLTTRIVYGGDGNPTHRRMFLERVREQRWKTREEKRRNCSLVLYLC